MLTTTVPHVIGLEPPVWEMLEALIAEYETVDHRSDQVRLIQMFYALREANKLESGDYIELGVHWGLTLKVIYKLMDHNQRLYALDTFTGFDERDASVERARFGTTWHEGNFHETSVSRVLDYVGDGAATSNLEIVEGWFPDTFTEALAARRWRFAHVDMDLYQPIKRALELLWPRMVTGGFIMMHDYGCHDFGARQALDEFCDSVGVFPVLLADFTTSAVIRKPR